MTGETHRDPSGWTPDTLKILEDEKILGLEGRVRIDVKRLEENIQGLRETVALISDNSRLAQDKFEATVGRDSVKQNEFRGSLEDLGKTMATRRELESAVSNLSDRMDELTKQIGDLRSRIDVGPSAIPQLQAQQNQTQGFHQGVRVTTTSIYMMLAAVGIVAGLVGHYIVH